MVRKKLDLLRYCIALLVIIAGLPAAALAQQPTVLAELFRNVGCTNCQSADDAYATFMSNNPGVVALINYHNNFPTPGDIFYIASSPSSGDRNNFYGVGSDPTACIDGFNAGSGSNTEKAWEHFSTSAIGHAANITPLVAHGPNGIDTITFSVTGTSGTQVIAYVAIKESQLYYDNPYDYGKPAGNLWNDVFRVMLPSPNGSSPFPFSGTHNFTVIYDSSKYARLFNGNPQNMTAVIFVQDSKASSGSNYQVEDLGEISLASPSAVTETINTPANRLIIPNNPLRANGAFEFQLASAGDVQITVFDLLGREVRTLVEGMMPSGETTVDMNGNVLPSGCYIARLTVDGREADQAKFIVAP